MADDTLPPAGGASADAPPLARAHRRTVWRVILVTQLVLALLSGATVALAWSRLDGQLAEGEKILRTKGMKKPEAQGPREPLNILLMGSDSRAGDNKIDGESDQGQRADVTILLHVSADRKQAYGVSLPRDAIVDRPACMTPGGDTIPAERDALFNEAFQVGGPLCTLQQVEKLTGVYVDHFLVLDFSGFVEMVDAVDGVEVCIPETVSDPAHDIYLEAGTRELDGRDALNYVRQRTVLSSTGDIGRMKRQQAFIASMVNKVLSAGTLSQPRKVNSFLRAVIGSIKVDDQLDSVKALADLAMQFRSTGLSDIQFVTVPIEAYPADPNRLQWRPEARKLWKRIKADQPLGREFSEEAISAAAPVGTPPGQQPSAPAGGPTDAPSSGAPSDPPSSAPTGAPAPQESTREDKAEAAAAGLCT